MEEEPSGGRPQAGGADLPSKTLTRSRLTRSLAELCRERGLGATQVIDLVSRAGVARSTFYDHFDDLERCLVEGLREAGDLLLASIDGGSRPLHDGYDRVVAGLIAFLEAEPARAWILFVEAPAAGQRALGVRSGLIGQVSARLARGGLDPESWIAPRPDPAVFAGGIFRLVGMRLCVGSTDTEELASGLSWWLGSYRAAGGRIPAIELPAFEELGELPSRPSIDARLTDRSGPRRSSRSRGRRRERILDAAMALLSTRDYAEVTVAEIAGLASLSRKAFYKEFESKSEMATAAAEQVFQAGMTACAAGFFDRPTAYWTTRIWRGGENLLSFLAENPIASYYAFVTGCSMGREAMDLIYSRTMAFTIFLEEASRASLPDARPPRLVHEALAATMFEWAFGELEARRGAAGLLESLPEIIYVILGPFVGPSAASEIAACQGSDGSESH